MLTDVAPLPVRERRRGRLELTGRLTQVAPDGAAAAWGDATGGDALEPRRRLLRLTPELVRLTTGDDAPRDVSADAYAEAAPDPVAPFEAEVLWHLQAGHPEQVLRLGDLLPRRAVAGARRVVPLRLDRRALVLRVEREHGHTDVPLALACASARQPGEVMAGLCALLGTCPRRAGRD